MKIGGVEVIDGIGCSEEEIKAYIRHVEEKTGGAVKRLVVEHDPDGVRLDYIVVQRKFERIRRICGYLVGTLERWNNSKKAEERERVKHA